MKPNKKELKMDIETLLEVNKMLLDEISELRDKLESAKRQVDRLLTQSECHA